MWNKLVPWITAARHTWIGMTIHTGSFANHFSRRPGGVPLLRGANPERYADLDLPSFDRPPPRRMHQGPAGFDPFGMHWWLAMATPQGPDIAADVIRLARSGQLPGVDGERMIAVGASQTARFWRLMIDSGRRCDDIDAYIHAVGPLPARLPPGAAFVHILSEAEVVGTLNPRWLRALDDGDAPMSRGYEIPGTSHDIRSHPAPPGHDRIHNDRPFEMLVRSIAENLDAWLVTGVDMPPSAHIMRDDDAFDGVARDEHGNARGGWRGPWLDVPTAQYLPRCSCGPTISEMIPFGEDKVAAMYESRSGYGEAFRRVVDKKEFARILLRADAEQLRTNVP